MNTQYKFHLHVQMPSGESNASAFNVDAYVARDAKWEPYAIKSRDLRNGYEQNDRHQPRGT